jgi:hypothetical protein
MEHFVADLRAAHLGQPVSVYQPAWHERVRKSVLSAGAAGAGTAGLFVGAALMWLLQRVFG